MPGVTAAAVLRHMLPESATLRAEGAWSFTTHIAVRTLEELAAQTRLYMRAHGVKKRDLPKPLIIPRPGDKSEKPPPVLGRSWVRDLVAAADVEVVTVG